MRRTRKASANATKHDDTSCRLDQLALARGFCATSGGMLTRPPAALDPQTAGNPDRNPTREHTRSTRVKTPAAVLHNAVCARIAKRAIVPQPQRAWGRQNRRRRHPWGGRIGLSRRRPATSLRTAGEAIERLSTSANGSRVGGAKRALNTRIWARVYEHACGGLEGKQGSDHPLRHV